MLARPPRETLIAALAAKRLDRTLTSALPPADQYDEASIGATGVAACDHAVAGGLPRGQLSEIVGAASSGRTSLLLQTMAAATARGELVAIVDALDRFDAESAAAAGVTLDRVLWVRGFVTVNPTRDQLARAVEQAIKAFTLILQAGNFGLAALDLGDAPEAALRGLPFTTWMRLQRMLEGQPTMGVLIANAPIARSAAGLSVVLQRPSETTASRRFTGRMFDGLEVDLRVRRARARTQEERTTHFATRAVAYV
jgi:recombination protein RecA